MRRTEPDVHGRLKATGEREVRSITARRDSGPASGVLRKLI
jgi:hypothetical protein